MLLALEAAAASMGGLERCTFKWKVATAPDALERQLLEQLLQRLPPTARLRLDANGGWDRSTAEAWMQRLRDDPRLDWLEQPLAVEDQAGLDQLAALGPVALDESLDQQPELRRSWSGWQVRRPALEGDPRLLLRELQAGLPQRMLSTAFETGIGRRWLEHLAGLQAQGPTPAAPGLAPGWTPGGADVLQRSRAGLGRGGMSELERLEQGLAAGQWVSLSPEADAAPIAQLPPGPGVVVRSGGSSGGSRCCAQPSLHLDRSAAATAHWLTGIGVDPASTLLLNPLPLAHVSGLMPWWRTRCWGVGHQQLPPGLMKTPTELLAFCQGLPAWGKNPAVLSLVPTQLARLLAHPDGVAFLQQLQLIWIGGAALPAVIGGSGTCQAAAAGALLRVDGDGGDGGGAASGAFSGRRAWLWGPADGCGTAAGR